MSLVLLRTATRTALLIAAAAAARPALAQRDSLPRAATEHDSAPHVSARLLVVHVAPERWRVSYEFDRPVTGVAFGPPAAGYRERAWQVTSAGASLVSTDAGEAVVARDSARTALSVTVHRYTRYAADSYAPAIPFSDGGTALFLGYFTGRAIVGTDTVPLDATIGVEGLAGEHALVPPAGGAAAYAYFGPQQPITTTHARLVVDPGTPPWLRDALIEVAARTTDVFTRKLGGDLPVPPLVLVGAGELDASDGMHVKGGAVGDQLALLVSGSALHEPSPRVRSAFERLAAHELAHLWQLHTLPQAFSDAEPWLHEGAAEAMAIQALRVAGLWDSTATTAYAESAARRCTRALDGRTLPQAVRAGSADATYACGLGLYWTAERDPMTIWMRLVRAVHGRGDPYTDATLARVTRTAEPDGS